MLLFTSVLAIAGIYELISCSLIRLRGGILNSSEIWQVYEVSKIEIPNTFEEGEKTFYSFYAMNYRYQPEKPEKKSERAPLS